MSPVRKALLTIFLVILADQLLKFYVKTNMYLGEEHKILGDWFIIHFTENNGMAFGFELEWKYGKIFLSVFRIIAVTGIGWYLASLIKKQANTILVISIALIFAGALGNIIDSVFYGILFSDSNYEVARLLPPEGGYADFLYGKVVDMFYFPIIEGHFPDWFPFWGTEEFIFFRPVFNIADASITTGVLMIVFFQSSFFGKVDESAENEFKEIKNESPEQTNTELGT